MEKGKKCRPQKHRIDHSQRSLFSIESAEALEGAFTKANTPLYDDRSFHQNIRSPQYLIEWRTHTTGIRATKSILIFPRGRGRARYP
jgi:hypothetical protein